MIRVLPIILLLLTPVQAAAEGEVERAAETCIAVLDQMSVAPLDASWQAGSQPTQWVGPDGRMHLAVDDRGAPPECTVYHEQATQIAWYDQAVAYFDDREAAGRALPGEAVLPYADNGMRSLLETWGELRRFAVICLSDTALVFVEADNSTARFSRFDFAMPECEGQDHAG